MKSEEKQAKSPKQLTTGHLTNHHHLATLTPLSDKRAQVKIQEMAFVLLALVFLFVLGFMFFSRLQFSNMEKRAEELREATALSVLNKISAMPELRCSASLGRATETLCLDKVKIEIFSEKFSEEYAKIWQGLSYVKVLQIFPSEKEYVIYYKNEGNLSYSNFVNLCSDENEGYACSLGMILVSMPA